MLGRPKPTGSTARAHVGMLHAHDVHPFWLLRLRALLASQAHGDDTAYRDYRDRYRDMAKTLGFEGHIAWVEALT